MSQRCHERTVPLVLLQQREPRGSSLDPQCKILLKLLEFASLVGTELIGAELDLDLIERPGELERHLRIVLVDDGRSSVLADVETLVEREPERLGQFDATSPTFLLSTVGGPVPPLPRPPPSQP